MMKRTFSLGMLGMALVSVVAAGSALAEETSRDKALGVIERAGSHLSNSSGFTLASEITYQLRMGDRAENVSTNYTLYFERPEKLFLHVKNEQVEALFLINDGGFITYIPEAAKYTSDTEKPKLATIIEGSSFGPLGGATAILAEFVHDKPFDRFLKNATEVSYVGAEKVDGTAADRVHVGNPEFDWDMWVASEGDPRILRVTPDMSRLLAEVNTKNIPASLAVSMVNRNWQLGDVADDKFEFTAPDGVKLVASLAPDQPDPPSFELRGKPAPEFTIDVMDGGTLNPAKKGKDEIYILDFWATWCGPCRQAMPIIDKVADEYADRGVKLFAVNLREEVADVKEFLTKQKLDVTVALDVKGEVAQLYKADAIPQTVIIGKDGTVQVVHVGFGPKLEQELRENLDDLLAGKNLTAK